MNEENLIRMCMADITGEVSLDMYVLKFPKELFDIMRSDDYRKNLRLASLNLVIKSIYSECYAQHVNQQNLDLGWVFSKTDTNLKNIKYCLKCWAEDGGVQEDVLNNILKSMEYEKRKIDIKPSELGVNDGLLSPIIYYKKNILLFYIAKQIADNLVVKLNDKEIKFYVVNSLESTSGKVRLISKIPEKIITKSKEKEFKHDITYFIDISINPILKENYPKLFINMGLIRIKAENNKFNSTSKKIHPYIFLNNRSSSSEVSGFIKGTINIKFGKEKDGQNNTEVFFNNSHWDKLLKKCLKYEYVELPSVKDLFENPTRYLYERNNFEIYIPNGNHFIFSSHYTKVGMDVFMRSNISLAIEKVLIENISDIFGSGLRVIERLTGTHSKLLTRKALPNVILKDEKKEIDLTVFYINNDFKSAFEKLIECYNNGIVKDNVLRSATVSLIRSLQPNAPRDIKVIPGKKREDYNADIEVKINVKFVSLIDDLNVNLNIEDTLIGISKKNNKSEYLKRKKDINSKIRENEKCIFRYFNFNNEIIPSIVELPNKDFFNKNHLIDLKTSLRQQFAKHNYLTQFFASGLEIDGEDVAGSNYNRMVSCIQECARMNGILTIDATKFLEKHVPNDITSIVGLYTSPNNDIIVLTSVMKGNLMGVAIGISHCWLPLDELLIKIATNINKPTIKADDVENALISLIEITGVNHILLITNRNTTKRIIPYFNYMDKNFNLGVKYKGCIDFKEKALDKSISEKFTVVAVDDESTGLCPEWIAIKEGLANDPTFIPNPLCKLNNEVYYGIAPKKQSMSHIAKTVKQKSPNKEVKKETAVMFSIPVTRSLYDNDIIAKTVFDLRKGGSIQYNLNDMTTFPYPLHLAKKCAEYIMEESYLYED